VSQPASVLRVRHHAECPDCFLLNICLHEKTSQVRPLKILLFQNLVLPRLVNHSDKFETHKATNSSFHFTTLAASQTTIPAWLAPTSPAWSTSSPSSPTAPCSASPRRWGLTRPPLQFFRRLLRRLGPWGCLGHSPQAKSATSACATAESKMASVPPCLVNV